MARVDAQDRTPPQKRTAKLLPCTCDPDRRLRRVPKEALQRFQGNMKTLHEDQYAKLKAAMEDKGFIAPVFVWAGHAHVLDGHQRLNVLKGEGWDVEDGVPVVEIEAVDETDAAEKLLLLSSTYGKVDPQGLYEFTETHGVKLTEFTLPDLPDFDLPAFTAEFYDSAPENPGDPEAVPEVPAKPVSQPGEVWICGSHRVMCGDATNPQHVARLMGSQQAALCFTSPPYAQQRDYTEESQGQDWNQLMQDVFSLLPMTEDGQVLVNLGLVHKDGEWVPYWDGWIEWMRQAGWRRYGWYVWDKKAALPADWQGRLAIRHEWVFHFNKAAVHPLKVELCMSGGEIIAKTAPRGKDGERRPMAWNGRPRNEMRVRESVCIVSKTAGGEHPAVFPTGLPAYFIESWPGDVYEPFLGSGTTLIAAEQLQRACYGMEIAPVYADVSVLRWAQLTGKEAVLEGDGRTFAQLASERGAHA